MDIGIPTGPLVLRVIWLRVDLGRDRLQHNHHAISLHDRPEVLIIPPIPATPVSDFKTQFPAVEIQARLQVVYDKERSNAVQRWHGAMLPQVKLPLP